MPVNRCKNSNLVVYLLKAVVSILALALKVRFFLSFTGVYAFGCANFFEV